MRLAFVLAPLLLAGCAATVMSSSPRTVVVRAQQGIPEGQPLAEAECAKYGRHAQFNKHERALTTLVFDCVL